MGVLGRESGETLIRQSPRLGVLGRESGETLIRQSPRSVTEWSAPSNFQFDRTERWYNVTQQIIICDEGLPTSKVLIPLVVRHDSRFGSQVLLDTRYLEPTIIKRYWSVVASTLMYAADLSY